MSAVQKLSVVPPIKVPPPYLTPLTRVRAVFNLSKRYGKKNFGKLALERGRFANGLGEDEEPPRDAVTGDAATGFDKATKQWLYDGRAIGRARPAV